MQKTGERNPGDEERRRLLHGGVGLVVDLYVTQH